MKETTQNLGKGMDLVQIIEPKFKTNTIMVMLLVPIVPEKNASYVLAQSMLTQSCRKYPDNAAMTVKLDDMYGAGLSAPVSVNGSVMSLSVRGSVIANQCALHGEDLLGEMTDLMLDCLFDPNVRDGAFDANEFRIQRKELLDSIQAEINNKRGYAMLRARQTAFVNEPDAYPLYGSQEEVEALTPEGVYAAYQELLRRAVVRVYYVGSEEPAGLSEKLTAAFSQIKDRAPEALPFEAPSPCKSECAHVTEQMDVSQSKLVLAFKGENIPGEAFRLFSAVFGGTPFSMLFTNVREKMSLCYYCASRVIEGKATLIVDSGVELANAEKTHEAVLAQLEAVRNGEFTDELVENAKRFMVNILRGIGDTPMSCIAEAYQRFYRHDDADVEERIQRYQALTREDIIAAAKALREDTVYLMQQGGTK
ncbi:MAG: insulinase family protein [Oscillospiraceae bacterium]|nr:insulinase family protein [Oscillospiraceae bacterium]